MDLLLLGAANKASAFQKSIVDGVGMNCSRSRHYLRKSASICGSVLGFSFIRVHSRFWFPDSVSVW
jgi:hypothetical protein